MSSEQPEKAAYAHGEYNLRPERIWPFMRLQRAVGMREIELHPAMTELDWINTYADAYRLFVDKNPEYLDRFTDASQIKDPLDQQETIRALVDELRQQLSN